MFVTGPPVPPGPGGGGPLRLHGAAGRTFGDWTGQALNPTLPGYIRDMTAPYGIAVREELIEQGVGHSYGEMCVPLLGELVSEQRPADLLVLATAIPDVRPGRATATYLSWQCPGAPLTFAVSDQGFLSAFTALRLIDGYVRTGDCRRAVLLVAEQPTLFHDLPVPTAVPERAAAVGVVLETDGAPQALPVRRHVVPDARHAADVLAAEAARLAGGSTVLVGAGLAEVAASLGGDVRACGAGQPFTGVWLELSRALPGLREKGGEILLAEYDPAMRLLFSVTLCCGS